MIRALALALVLSSTVARADVIPEDYVAPVCPPITCPAGSVGGSGGHGSCPSACVPWAQTCTADGECGGPGWICRPTRFCLEMRPTGRMVQNVVVGECAADGSCATGTCTEASRCMPDPSYVALPEAATPSGAAPSSSASSPSGGMCAIGRSGEPVAVVATGLALVLVASRRRRR